MTSTGDVLLWGACALAVAAAALHTIPVRPWRARLLWAHRATLASWALLTGALAILVTAFLVSDLSIRYVWEHTRTDYPVAYKLAGLWAGQGGTALLWAWLMATALVIEKRRVFGALRAPRLLEANVDARRVHVTAATILLSVVGAFSAFLAVTGVFAPTPGDVLTAPATRAGRGLVEVLVTPLMVIHPPIQFVAYALIALPAALALGALASAAPVSAWTAGALMWARTAWLFATVGLGLGGLWAYYVLSFGGYWAWDPVETSNLLPWLALTGFLHAGKYADRFKDYPLAAPALAFAAWWLTFFATFATRSGLWVSVHAFTDPTNRFDPDAFARVVSIMATHVPTRFFVALLVVLGLVAASLLVARHARPLGPRGAVVAQAYAVACAIAAGFALAAPVAFVSGLFEVGAVLARGHVAAGVGGFVAAFVGLPLLWLYVEQPDDTSSSARAQRDWSRGLMYAGVVLFTVALVVTFLLNLQVVNGFDRTLFDVRAPFLVVPIVLVLTVMLAHGVIGRAGALALAGAGAGVAVAATLAAPEQWAVTVGVPTVATAGIAALLKIVHVNRGAAGPARWAGVTLLAASVLGAVFWSNPPSTLDVFGATFTPGVASGFLFFGCATVGLAGAIAALTGRAWRVAVAGGVAATVAAGYGVGAVLGVAALALVVWRRRDFQTTAFWPASRSNVRQTGIYLVHFALAIGLVGYAASTYAQDKDAYRDLTLATDAPFADGTVTALAATGEARHLVVPIVVTDGERETRAELAFERKGGNLNHYAQDLRVERGVWRDTYAAGFGLTFTDGTRVNTLDPVPPHDPSEVSAVTFELTVLPLMTFVWAGLWLMGLGMLSILAAAFVPAATKPAGLRRAAMADRPVIKP